MASEAGVKTPGEQTPTELASQQKIAQGSSSKMVGDGYRSKNADNECVHARAPTPLGNPKGRDPIIELPDRDHEDRHADQDRGEEKLRKRRSLRHPLAVVSALVFVCALVSAAYLYWDYAQRFQSTDDAYIATRLFSIAPEVPGYITSVIVTDNQHVAAGGVIAQIDDRNYRIVLDQAKAQLAHDQAVLEQAQRNLTRYQVLGKTSAIPEQQIDDQQYLVLQDSATVTLDQAKVDAAQLNLSYATVTTAQSGHIVSLTAAIGQYAQAGMTLTMFIPDQIWITANFKETQLDAMRPGQPATIRIDAYPERTIRGHVASVQPGSGPAFSLLPPENATGNWVKIVQRVPVKIIIDDPPKDVVLGPGMSVEVTVQVNGSPSILERLKSWL